MKKFFTIIMTICLLTSALCITAFAAESTSVIKVQYDSETKTFDVFDDGWNFAMETAKDEKEVYVTLLKDWKAEDGQFTDDFSNGAGFDYDAIYFADDVTITLDLNGHTIDRGLTSSEANGEVMFINDGANVTIKNGTIKGGYSNNGAGGIHMEDAKVSLIDLVFTNNRVRDDDGAAIQHNDGGELYMKNCRFVDNDCSDKGLDIYGTVYLDSADKVLIEDCYFADNDNIDYGAGIYASEVDDFQIKNTTFENLHAGDRGGAIWIKGMENKVYIYNCKFNNNSAGNYGGAICSQAELYVYDSEFNGNQADWDGGAIYLDAETGDQGSIYSYFYRTVFDKNHAGWDGGAIFCNTKGNVVSSTSGSAKAYGCTFTGNSAEDEGGAVYVNSEASFDFASDEETGKPGSMTGNEAREAGGAIFQDNISDVEARIRMSGEVYVKDNVSSLGKDDIYLVSGYDLYIKDITSPKGSIGIRLDSDDGGRAATFLEGNTILSCEAFFANNEGFEIVIGEKITYSITGNTSEPCVDMVKSNSGVGSIFGEGSLTMIVSLAALVASGVSIFLIVDMKKKLVPATAKNTEENEE